MLVVALVLTLAAIADGIGKPSPNMYLVEVQAGEKEEQKEGQNVLDIQSITASWEEVANDYQGGL